MSSLSLVAALVTGGCGRPTADGVAQRVEKAYASASALEQISSIARHVKLLEKKDVRTTQSRFYYKRSRYLRLETGPGTLTAKVVCDGKNLYARAVNPQSWLREPAPKKWADSELLRLYVQPSQELMLAMLDGGSPLSGAEDLSMAEELERVSGTKCYVLSMSTEDSRGGTAFSFKKEQRLWVSTRDSLIRKFAVKLVPTGSGNLGQLEALIKKMEASEVEVAKPRLHLTAGDGLFSFKSPPGAHVITYQPGGPLGAWTTARDPMAAAKSMVGQEAPELSLRTWVQGPATSLAALKGKVVLLDFWATWCVPCVETVPTLQQMHKEFASRGLAVIGVHDNSVGEAEVRRFMKNHGMTYRVAVDEEDADMRPVTHVRYKGTAIPMAVLIDRSGVVSWVGHPADKKALQAEMEALL